MSDDFVETYTPTDEELKARKKRNMAIALLLAAFVVIVFVTLISKGVTIFDAAQEGVSDA